MGMGGLGSPALAVLVAGGGPGGGGGRKAAPAGVPLRAADGDMTFLPGNGAALLGSLGGSGGAATSCALKALD